MNQVRASKINDSGYSAYQRVFGRNPPQMEMPFGVRKSRSRGREQASNRRTGTRTVDDYETPCPTGKFSLGPQTSLETSPAPRSETLQGRAACWTPPLVLTTWSECSQETNKRLLAPGRGHQQHVGPSLNCLPRFRSQACTIPGSTVSRRGGT